MRLIFKRLESRATLPTYAHNDDSGFDLYALEDTYIPPHAVVAVPTGLAVKIPEPFWVLTNITSQPYKLTPEIQVRPKSGLTLIKGVTVANTPGTVDNGYRGELKVLMMSVKRGTPWQSLCANTFRFLRAIGMLNMTVSDYHQVLSKYGHGYFVAKGTKIAQGVLGLVMTTPFVTIEETVYDLDDTSRGEGGFGSTGGI